MFESTHSVPFEGYQFQLTDKSDEMLRTTFGDYWRFPPEEERVCKHNPEVISFGDEGHLHNLQNITAVHKDVTERLEKLNKALFDEVRAVLDINKAERHVRGGEATKQKYIRNSAITSK